MFAKVKEELEKHPTAAECFDLHPEALNLFSTFMLGQAQECFYEKVRRTSLELNLPF